MYNSLNSIARARLSKDARSNLQPRELQRLMAQAEVKPTRVAANPSTLPRFQAATPSMSRPPSGNTIRGGGDPIQVSGDFGRIVDAAVRIDGLVRAIRNNDVDSAVRMAVGFGGGGLNIGDYRNFVNVPDYRNFVNVPNYRNFINVPEYRNFVNVPNYRKFVNVPNFRSAISGFLP